MKWKIERNIDEITNKIFKYIFVGEEDNFPLVFDISVILHFLAQPNLTIEKYFEQSIGWKGTGKLKFYFKSDKIYDNVFINTHFDSISPVIVLPSKSDALIFCDFFEKYNEKDIKWNYFLVKLRNENTISLIRVDLQSEVRIPYLV